MAEFGGSLVDENAEAEGSREGVETMPAGTMEDGIELDEYQLRPQDGELMDIGESLLYLIGAT